MYILTDHTILVDLLSAIPINLSSVIVGNPSSRKKSHYFLPLDGFLFEKVCSIDESKSINIERWATHWFNSWQKLVGLSIELSIVNLPLKEFVDLLTKFFLYLLKDNGEKYPLGSIGNIY